MTLTRHEAAYAPPTDAEKWVIGSALVDPACLPKILRVVRSADFADGELRAVFEAIAKRHHAGQPVDVALLIDELKASPHIDDPRSLLVTIAGEIHTAAHAEHYAEIVGDASRKRRIFDAAEAAWNGASNGHTSLEVINELHAFCEDELRGGAGAGVEAFTLGELVAAYPELRPPVVDGLFRRGETINVISASKVGKSWLAYGLALSIATGQDWLGRLTTAPGRVLLIDNELHRETLASRLPFVADAMGIPLADIESKVTIWPLRGALQSLGSLASRFGAIEPGEYQAVILDAKYRFVEEGASENDNAAETRFYNTVDQLARHTDAAFVMVHHESKGFQGNKSVTDVGAGAGAQSRAADCHLVLRRHEEEGAFVLDAAVRSFKPVDPFAIRFEFPVWEPDLSLDPTRLAGQPGTAEEKAAARERVKEEQRDSDAVKVLEAMRSLGRPETKSIIGGAAKLNPARTASAIGFLVLEGHARDADVERSNGQKYPGYELTEECNDDAIHAA